MDIIPHTLDPSATAAALALCAGAGAWLVGCCVDEIVRLSTRP